MATSDVNGFFGTLSEEDVKAAAAAQTAAKEVDEGGFTKRSQIKCAGNFLMRAIDEAYIVKKDNNKLVRYPEVKLSKNDNLMVVVRLELVEDVLDIRAGSTFTVYIPFIAKAGSSQVDQEKLMNMAKPRIMAMLPEGAEIKLTDQEWVLSKLQSKLKKPTADTVEIVSSHGLTETVLVTLTDGISKSGDPEVNMSKIVRATADSKSVVDMISYNEFKTREKAEAENDGSSSSSGFGDAPKTESSSNEAGGTPVEDDLPF